MSDEPEGRVRKNYAVRHHPKYSRTWLPAGYFETLQEAYKKYRELNQLHPDERVWIIDLMTDVHHADSHPPRRR